MPKGAIQESDQWYLEVNGKKFGPYSMAQIQELLRHEEIVGEDKITGSHLEGQWISIKDFVKRSVSSSPAPRAEIQTQVRHSTSSDHSVPPRPDERTLTSLQAPSRTILRQPGHDPVDGLFEILQATRDRKAMKKSMAHFVPQMAHPIREPGSKLFWASVPFVVVGVIAFWKLSASMSDPNIPAAADSALARSSAATLSNTRPANPNAVTVAAKPSASPSKLKSLPVVPPPGFTAGKPVANTAANAAADRERELERERQRERDREQDREAELARDDRDRDAIRDRDRDPARERERDPNRERERDPSRDRDRDPGRERERDSDPYANGDSQSGSSSFSRDRDRSQEPNLPASETR